MRQKLLSGWWECVPLPQVRKSFQNGFQNCGIWCCFFFFKYQCTVTNCIVKTVLGFFFLHYACMYAQRALCLCIQIFNLNILLHPTLNKMFYKSKPSGYSSTFELCFALEILVPLDFRRLTGKCWLVGVLNPSSGLSFFGGW